MEWEMDPSKGIELRRKARATRWTKHQRHMKDTNYQMDILKKRAEEELRDRRFHATEALQTALDSFPARTGRGAGQWAPDQLRALSPSGREGLLMVPNMCERRLQWPPQLMQNWHAALPMGGSEMQVNGDQLGYYRCRCECGKMT
eukprot:3879961-Pyramimonas_sp.AAC.1